MKGNNFKMVPGVPKWIGVGILPILFILLGIYISIALRAKRFLPLQDVGHFVWTLAIASLVHYDSAGGPRAFSIISDAVSTQAVTQTAVKVEGKRVTLPLPPYTIRASCDRIIRRLPKDPTSQGPPSCQAGASFLKESQYFLTLTSGENFYQRYLEKTLPEAGWVQSDRLGGAIFYIKKGHTLKIMMLVGSYLTGNIVQFTIIEPDGFNNTDMLQIVPQNP
jgi:hypothetical protein